MGTGKGSLSLFDFSLEFLDGSLVLADIFLVFFLDQFDEMVQDTLIEIFSSQMSVTVGADDFENSVINGQNGNIESTTLKLNIKKTLKLQNIQITHEKNIKTI